MNQSKLYAPPHRQGYRRPSRPRHRVKPRPYGFQPQPWLLGSLALLALALVPQNLWSRLSTPLSTHTAQLQTVQSQAVQSWPLNHTNTASTCQAIINADQRLSRSQLNQFLSVSPNSSQAKVHETIAPPYCTISKAHHANQREAYPLAFDPETWFVVNYEQGLYKSYDFVFQK